MALHRRGVISTNSIHDNQKESQQDGTERLPNFLYTGDKSANESHPSRSSSQIGYCNDDELVTYEEHGKSKIQLAP